jgi:hypothetical protein
MLRLTRTARFVGRLRLFRYEVRCWRGGTIPDLAEAVGGARRLTSDALIARRLLDLGASVPRPVWGRDELHAGEMWNSNSLIAWLIATAGLATDALRPPGRGRAPGWDAGLAVARRSGTCGPADAVDHAVLGAGAGDPESVPTRSTFGPVDAATRRTSSSAGRMRCV